MVRPAGECYQIIHGERRWRAAAIAGMTDIEAVLREAGDGETYELSLVENVQRESLTPMEEAQAFRELQARGHTQ